VGSFPLAKYLYYYDCFASYYCSIYQSTMYAEWLNVQCATVLYWSSYFE